MDQRAGERMGTPEDRTFLERTVVLGRRGWGSVHPNPMVGCVIVRDGEVVGEGWHERVGGPHAEIHALSRAGERARGATAYVSLEPCNHFGRTPPCSEALVEAGVTRVVYGGREPGVASSGGAETLRSHGIDVVGPLFSEAEARRENPAFYYNQEHRATYVALKLAQTLDGRIAARPGQRTAITGPEALGEVHRLRAGFDAVMVGAETVRVDNPRLTVRSDVPVRTPPARIVLDTWARTSPEAHLFQEAGEIPVMVLAAEDAPPDAIRQLVNAGARVRLIPHGPGGLALRAALDACWEMGISSVLCEGGARLGQALIEDHLVRRLFLFVAPFVLGAQGVSAFPEPGPREAWEVWEPAAPPKLFGRDTLMIFDRMD